jgi:hypothetical protein
MKEIYLVGEISFNYLDYEISEKAKMQRGEVRQEIANKIRYLSTGTPETPQQSTLSRRVFPH